MLVMTAQQTSDLISLNLDELDDNEFAIPAIDGPLPTLESILNQPDNNSLEDDIELDGISANDLFDSTDNSSICSYDSKGVRKLQTNANDESETYMRNTNETIVGSLLKHNKLRVMSSQLRSANSERSKAGKPSVITISTCYVAIGTSHGYVLVFDLKQVMKWCLRNNDDFGSVSAISVKRDNSRILCGFSRGHVTLWNLLSGELIRVYNELHSPHTTVLHLKYLSDGNYGVLSDSSGSVFTLDFRKKDVDSQCIFSGSRGEVLAIDPLLLPVNSREEINNFNTICLLSMATVTKVIAISIRPSINVHFTHLLKGNSDTLPLLSWQFVMVQVSEETKVIDPVLAFARQSDIYFFQASIKTNTKVFFTPLIHLKVNYILQNITWLSSRTLVTIDNLEKLHLIDVRSEEELEVIEIEEIELVYGSAHFKSLATGGLVSPAMATAGKRACYHSICVSNYSLTNISSPHLLILGINSVHMFSIRSWNERIDLLVKENKYHSALSIALSFYNDTTKAIVGLNGKKQDKRLIIAEKLMEILNLYVDSALTKMCPEMGKIEILFEHYKNLIPTCIEYSIAIDKQDLIFSKLYEKFSADSISKNIFLDSLEPYILNDNLRNLSPLIVQELFNYYAEKKLFTALEAMVIHLEISSLDIHQVMTICWRHSLFNAIFYIYNQAFDDYITPFNELLILLQKAISKSDQLSDMEINLGNKLLLYISSCLTGKTYPHNGYISSDKKSQIIKDILSRLTKFRSNDCALNNSNEPIYPNLRILLNFDTKEFFNVLSIAFDDMDPRDISLIDQKQRIVDILLRILVENSEFSISQIGCLFIFLARQLIKRNNNIFISNMLFDQIIEYLTSPDDDSQSDERQQALLNLLQTEKRITIDNEKLLKLAERAKL